MDKWKKAVIHLECATDNEHSYDRMQRTEALMKNLSEGRITEQQFNELSYGKSKDLRCQGTAIFLKYEEKRYLITARHVLWNEHSAKREFEEEVNRSQSLPEHMRQSIIESANEKALNQIFGIIFRVPSFDEVLQNDTETNREFLMNLGAGVPWMTPYTFSSPELDIAVISLDQRNTRLADELEKKGYEPISVGDISEAPSKETAEVFTVGFPSSTALLGEINQHPAQDDWSSKYFSLPTFSFGHVSMLHDDLKFYWVDMSIYPGNSGGPVIENDKLVGIVSKQAIIPIENAEQFHTRIPFGKIIKSKYILPLLERQIQKDKDKTNISVMPRMKAALEVDSHETEAKGENG